MALNSSAPETRARRRILIVDDHALVRRGLTALIDNEADLLVCAEVATEREGLDAIPVPKPDLVIADLSLKDCESLDMVKAIRLRHDGLPVLLLSTHDAPICAERALQAGASVPQELTDRLIHQIDPDVTPLAFEVVESMVHRNPIDPRIDLRKLFEGVHVLIDLEEDILQKIAGYLLPRGEAVENIQDTVAVLPVQVVK